jgi:hypothetical protein
MVSGRDMGVSIRSTQGGFMFKRQLTATLTFFSISAAFFSANAAPAYQGYLFCASGQTAYLIDPTGASVHTWKATGTARSCAYLLPDGSALFPIQTSCTVRSDGAYGHGRVQKISWEGQVVWDAVVCDATYTPGYDIEPMPSGNFLVAGATNTGGLKIVEIKPEGASAKTVVWEYVLPDSLGKTGYINSVSYNPELKYIGIDINQARKLVVIDYEKKNIVYTYLVGSSGATHAAMWITKYFLGTDIENPDVNITAMRTNNLLVVHNSTEVVEVNPVTRTKVKSIPFSFSDHEGSVQRLPNGNTLVNSANNKATELDENGATVRTVNLPGTVARVYMYGSAYPGLKTYTGVVTTSPGSAAGGIFSYHSIAHGGKITVAGQKGTPFRVRILTLDGKAVYSACCYGSEAVFSTEKFMAGVYFVEIQYAQKSLRTGFVVVR